MKTVVIPSGADPFVCCINGVNYCYSAGITQSVPDEVAELIEIIGRVEPVHFDKVQCNPDEIKILAGGKLTIDGDAKVTGLITEIPTASASVKGGVKVGAGLAIASGVLSVKAATAAAVGGVKVGAGLAVATDGTVSLPTAPTEAGAYVLTCTVADGAAAYSWESAGE